MICFSETESRAKSGTMSGTTDAQNRAFSCVAVRRASEWARRKLLSLNAPDLAHNAGVVGSSPTPAIEGRSAQVASGQTDTRSARFVVFAAAKWCGTMS
ncbi:MAG TPA: hypothetical protein VHB25_04280, partial [Gemmatimonadaceae bacterium]|nr:hypothetical protein [Gemmatimonadaceae bacterium]